MQRGNNTDHSALRFIDAARVNGPAGVLADVDLCDRDDRPLGNLEGVLVDPVERRLRFYVVGASRRHFLLPTDWPVQVAQGGRRLRIDADPSQLAACDEFQQSDVPAYSDDDLLASLFRPRVA